jgi:hypothetical protein
MTSAAHQVASTTELTELILLHTDMRTLLVSAQRVCKAWQSLVQTSRPLQRALYFEAIAPSSDEDITVGRTMNPLLMQTFPTFFRTRWNEVVGTPYSKEFTTSLNPFGFMDETRVGALSETTRSSIAVHGASEPTKREAYLRKDASWRRMQVQHPAAPNIGFSEAHMAAEPSYHTDIISAPAGHGVTMGMLYDTVYQFMGEPHTSSAFRVHWRDLSRDRKYEYWPLKANGMCLGNEYDFPDNVGVVVMRRTSSWNVRIPADVSILDKRYRPEGMQLYQTHLVCRYYIDMFG